MKYNFTFLIIFIGISSVFAQDAYYAQFYENPLFLNPASTGYISGSYRLGLAHRSQWQGIEGIGGYATPAASFDFNLSDLGEGSTAGFGLAFMNDKQGSGKIRNNSALLSTAYHLSFDKDKTHFLSIGIQGGILTQKLDPTLQFESDLFGGAGESIQNLRAINPDIRIGTIWSSFLKTGTMIRVGISYAHLGENTVTFISGNSPIQGRLSAHGELELTKGQQLKIKPLFLVMVQGPSRLIQVGTMLEYDFLTSTKLLTGIQYRVGDAAIFYAGMEFNQLVRGMISYDFPLGGLAKTQRFQGGSVEFSVVYTGLIARSRHNVDPSRRYLGD